MSDKPKTLTLNFTKLSARLLNNLMSMPDLVADLKNLRHAGFLQDNLSAAFDDTKDKDAESVPFPVEATIPQIDAAKAFVTAAASKNRLGAAKPITNLLVELELGV